MKRVTFPRLRAALVLALGASAVACTDTLPDGNAPDESVASERPSRPATDDPAAERAFLRVTGPDGAAPRVGPDGKVRVEVRVGRVEALRTVGLDVGIEGAEILEWERDDALLRSAGGDLIALESRLAGDTLSVVVGTTAPVSSSSEDGARVLSLVLAPKAEQIRIALGTSGAMRGLLDESGARLEVYTDDALIAREGE